MIELNIGRFYELFLDLWNIEKFREKNPES